MFLGRNDCSDSFSDDLKFGLFCCCVDGKRLSLGKNLPSKSSGSVDLFVVDGLRPCKLELPGKPVVAGLLPLEGKSTPYLFTCFPPKL